MSDAPAKPPPTRDPLCSKSGLRTLNRPQSRVVQDMERHGYPKASLFAVRLALHEAMSNAFAHGHKNMPDAPVTLQFSVSPQQAEITVKDQGPGFDPPPPSPDPTLDENLERGLRPRPAPDPRLHDQRRVQRQGQRPADGVQAALGGLSPPLDPAAAAGPSTGGPNHLSCKSQSLSEGCPRQSWG